MTIVAIHQPNFFPWLGYFKKITVSDRFIFLNDAQFPLGMGNWGNRVSLLVADESRWVTAPVVRSGAGEQRISEVKFAERANWRGKFIRTLETNYRKAPFYEETMQFLRPLIENPDSSLASYNMHAIRAISAVLGIEEGKLVVASDIGTGEVSTQRLIALTKALGGTVYLSGDGAGGYQDDAAFAEASIALQALSFKHPRYRQLAANEEFVPGLSIIDPLMNIGADNTAEMLAEDTRVGDAS